MTNPAPLVICVVGPTASGKSDLAQQIALKLDGEVVSADSMQIYKGMDIGTGKVPVEDRLVAHYGLDLVDPGAPYSAALYQSYARACFDDIHSRGKRSVLAGGTGLYVRSAIDDYHFPAGEQCDNPVREKFMAFAEKNGNLALWQLLEKRDPASAREIHPNNVRRVVRAFELLGEGKSYAEQKANLQTLPQAVGAVFIGIAFDPAALNERINRRVDGMIEAGLVCEVKQLVSQGFRDGVTAPQAIGYKEIVAALDGKTTMAEAIEAVKLASRRYAKRQRTWFRKDQRIHWIDGTEDPDTRLSKALEIIAKADKSATADSADATICKDTPKRVSANELQR